MNQLDNEPLDQIPVDVDQNQALIPDISNNNFTDSQLKDLNSEPKKPKGWGKRHTLAILSFWGFSMAYAMRFNLAIAIVAMVKDSSQIPSNHFALNLTSKISDPLHILNGQECPRDPENPSPHYNSTEDDPGEFYWDEGDQGLILGSFFWGYIATQLPGGFIAKRFGGKWPLGIGLCITAFMTLLTPLAARTNMFMLIYVRVVEGLAQGMIFPAMQTLLASWSPPNERSLLSAITYSGMQFGAAMTMITSGYLIESEGGWPSVFHFTGGLTILWFAFWATFVSNTPEEHPHISIEEKNYIQKSLGGKSSNENLPTPWKKIFTSVPVWAIIIAQFGHTWGFYTLLTEIPTYFKNVLHFDIKQDSWLSAMPEMFMWLFANVSTFIADYCITKKWARTITVRKTCHAIAEIGAALCVLGASFMGCNRTGAVAFLTMAVSVSGAVCASYMPNQIDIAPNHAGIMMGITNTISNFAGFATAMVAGALTNHQSTVYSWRIVFFITAGFYLVDATVYLCFTSSDEQSWNRKQPTSGADIDNDIEKHTGVESEIITDSRDIQTRPLITPD